MSAMLWLIIGLHMQAISPVEEMIVLILWSQLYLKNKTLTKSCFESRKSTFYLFFEVMHIHVCVCVSEQKRERDSRQWHLSRINMHIHGTGDNPARATGCALWAWIKPHHPRQTDQQASCDVTSQRPLQPNNSLIYPGKTSVVCWKCNKRSSSTFSTPIKHRHVALRHWKRENLCTVS